MEYSQRPTHKPEKNMLIFVVIVSFAALCFGGYYLWHHVAAPFAISYTGSRYISQDDQENAKKQKAKMSDTDSDGLSDYDELYIFGTSPYLLDSDSDGYADMAEVQGGQDPNCAQGSTCEADDAPQQTATVVPQVPQEKSNDSAIKDMILQLQSVSVDQMRELLVESGAPQADVDALTDDQVTALYQSALEKAGEQAQNQSP
jgi:hypothetical protein